MASPTLVKGLTNAATKGLMKVQLAYYDIMNKPIGKWQTINLILESCNDDNIVEMMKKYIDEHKE